MFFQVSITGFEWVLGLALMFGIAFILTLITYKSLMSFVVWLTMTCAFVVYGGLLDLWVLIMCLIILTIVVFMQMRSQAVSDQ